MDVVLLFPGQGSQKPGMGKDLAEVFPAAKAAFDAADKALGVSLSKLMFEGPAEELTITHNAQPALLTHGAAIWAVVKDRLRGQVRAAAGHSLGEITAYHAAGVFGLDDAVKLVRRRGELMYETGVKNPGTMAAILGDLSRPIEEICDEATRGVGTVVPANYNCPGQVVISGQVAGVERAMELCKAAGAKRAMKLNVSGAFHSPLMKPAENGFILALAQAMAARTQEQLPFPVYANVNTAPVSSGGDAIMIVLAAQLAAPVRWCMEIENMADAYGDATFVEMGPGNVLSGLVKKIAPSVKTMTCGTVPEVERLLELAA